MLLRLVIGFAVGSALIVFSAGPGSAQSYPSIDKLKECPRASEQPPPREPQKDPLKMTPEEQEAAFNEIRHFVTPEYQQAHPPCRIHHDDGPREMPGRPALPTPEEIQRGVQETERVMKEQQQKATPQ